MMSADISLLSEFKNNNNPFTEIFSLIKRYEISSDGFSTFVYDTDEIKALHQHADNAIGIVLQGLQDVGSLISIAEKNKSKIPSDLNGIGYLLTGIGNLAEALHVLKSDVDFVLRQRGVCDY